MIWVQNRRERSPTHKSHTVVVFQWHIYRDIPMPLVSSGVEHGNLRELALARMKDLGTQCRDVRTREVGIQEIHHKVKPYEVCVLTHMFQGLRSSLIRVYTVCHSVCIVWTNYSVVKQYCSNVRIITANFSGVWIFWIFMVLLIISSWKWFIVVITL